MSAKDRLRQTAFEVRKDNSAYVLLYDASSSVSQPDFRRMVDSGFSFADAVLAGQNSRCLVSICQFADTFQKECDLTDDLSRIRSKGNAIRKLDTGTDTALALREAAKILSGPHGKMQKVILLFTDGHPNDQTECMLASNEVRSLGIDLFGVGIGNLDGSKIEQVCTKEKTFLLPEYGSLIDAMPSEFFPRSFGTKPRGNLVVGSKIDLLFRQKKKPIDLRKDDLTIVVSITNQSPEVIHQDSLLLVGPEDDPPWFFKSGLAIVGKELRNGQSADLEVTLRLSLITNHLYGMPLVRKLPQFIPVSLKLKNQVYDTDVSGFELRASSILGEILNFDFPSPPDSANILIFGPMGTGKSTLINRFFSLWHEQNVNRAKSRQDTDHVTLVNQQVTDSPNSAFASKFRFFDTVGLHYDTYSSGQLQHILRGNVRVSSFDDEFLKSQNQGIPTTNANIYGRMHSVLFVFHQKTFDEMRVSPAVLKKVKDTIKQLTDEGLDPIFIVTNMDSTSEAEESVGSKFSKLLGHDFENFYFVRNSPELYRKAANLNFENEKVLVTILGEALQRAKNFVEMNP